ncbi:efflux RND transporter periplasmic adaptor subunit [Bacteroides intestinalis]|uniref:HlyD family efflux transporter periplasmic adaptor subunit n=1 Tax=Bacteroides intestinalis TaxID=329854 RepID=A0A414LDF6_9BACE|nr:HlyD family efflux transporter periplasmic adaptor subunit [Bacteroides intestinalis]RHE92568.1 HlyD family efflux transporter periplasmic adaptor subunit [Bacteroides intestinalis]
MDTLIEKKKGLKRKHIPYIIAGLLLTLAAGWLFFGNQTRRVRVDRSTLNIQPVVKGLFNDYMRVNGQVLPIRTVQLSAMEGGMVAEKIVEEGATVEQGEVIVRLTNPMLNLSILDSEAQLAEKQNFLRNTLLDMEQNGLSLKKDQLQFDIEVGRQKRRFEQYERLYGEKLVSREEYLQAKEEYELILNKRDIVVESRKQDFIYRNVQVRQLEESLDNMQRNLVLVRQRGEDLNVKAPVSGQLGLLDVEIGQSISAGTRIGQINVLSDFKVEASIDEHYIDRVREGLNAIFERQDKNYALRVRKVYPEVRDKQFKTDFVFEGERPDNIRTGQTYYINLQLGQPVDAVLIPRGAFYQSTGGQWIFVITPDGKKAVRRNVQIKRQNPMYYEVISGLEPGEEVVISSYERFADAGELILKN